MIKSFPFNAIYDSNGVPDRAYWQKILLDTLPNL